MKKSLFMVMIMMVMVMLSGCASMQMFDNKKEVGATHGALTGAATGAIVGSPTLVGAGVGAFAGGVVGLCVGDYFDKQDPRYYVDRNSNGATVEIKSGPFKMNESEDLWYIVYEKDGKPMLAKKALKDKSWQQVK